jgi:hypothetical protein
VITLNRRTGSKKRSLDFTVSRSENDEKILICTIADTKSKSGYIGVDAVREMINSLETKGYDKGVIIKKITNPARREIKVPNIELFFHNFSCFF